MSEEDEECLEEGQERCPYCAALNWPGAMEYCEHYLWNDWCGDLIWEIPEAAELRKVAQQFCDLAQQADEAEELAETLSALQDLGHDDLATILSSPWDAIAEDLMSPTYVLHGEIRETDGMLSGSGSFQYLAGNAAKWAQLRSQKLREVLKVVEGKFRSSQPRPS